MKAMVLGASGMLGHAVVMVLEENGHQVVSVSRKGTYGRNPVKVNLEEWPTLQLEIAKHKPDFIVNAAGLLNDEVDRNASSAILVNSFLPRKLAEVARDMGYRLITISSDCVFEGDRGSYTISHVPDAQSAYGRSKHFGEVTNNHDLTIRTSIIGPEIDPNGRGLMQWFMTQEMQVEGWSEAIWTGVTTLELARVINAVLVGQVKETGLWHFVPSNSITKFELLKLINEVFRDSALTITEVAGLSHDRSLINDRPTAWVVPSYSRMLLDLSQWIDMHRDVYQGTVFDFSIGNLDLENL